uniref:Uncharacterized protein n=1 Tax=Curvibacter symbiont subsp. Hydra magnipapillata TaxID=667019 RepID=C9Y6P1_CURXX|nr:hypothetical protein Csp_E36180 [Curvibacter putative symbiont of Hydra magnipapillata]
MLANLIWAATNGRQFTIQIKEAASAGKIRPPELASELVASYIKHGTIVDGSTNPIGRAIVSIDDNIVSSPETFFEIGQHFDGILEADIYFSADLKFHNMAKSGYGLNVIEVSNLLRKYKDRIKENIFHFTKTQSDKVQAEFQKIDAEKFSQLYVLQNRVKELSSRLIECEKNNRTSGNSVDSKNSENIMVQRAISGEKFGRNDFDLIKNSPVLQSIFERHEAEKKTLANQISIIAKARDDAEAMNNALKSSIRPNDGDKARYNIFAVSFMIFIMLVVISTLIAYVYAGVNDRNMEIRGLKAQISNAKSQIEDKEKQINLLLSRESVSADVRDGVGGATIERIGSTHPKQGTTTSQNRGIVKAGRDAELTRRAGSESAVSGNIETTTTEVNKRVDSHVETDKIKAMPGELEKNRTTPTEPEKNKDSPTSYLINENGRSASYNVVIPVHLRYSMKNLDAFVQKQCKLNSLEIEGIKNAVLNSNRKLLKKNGEIWLSDGKKKSSFL